MKIGIILNRIGFEEKKLIKELSARNHKVLQINNQNIFFDLQKNSRIIESLKNNLDIVLQRSLSLTRGLYSTAILESYGMKLINGYDTIRISGDKLLTTLTLIKAGIPTPLTAVAFTRDAALEALDEVIGYPSVIKPIFGSWGRLIAMLGDKNTANAVLEDREIMGNVWQKIYYLQKYIATGDSGRKEPTDIRIFYLGGRCIAGMGRYAKPGEFRSNIAIGGTAQKIEITDELETLCGKIAEAIGGEILGIDLIRSGDNYLCLEVNGTPQYKGLMDCTGINIAAEIADYLEEKYG